MIEIEVWIDVDNAEHGHWCEQCLLPSAILAPVCIGQSSTGSVIVCPTCGWRAGS